MISSLQRLTRAAKAMAAVGALWSVVSLAHAGVVVSVGAGAPVVAYPAPCVTYVPYGYVGVPAIAPLPEANYSPTPTVVGSTVITEPTPGVLVQTPVQTTVVPVVTYDCGPVVWGGHYRR